MVTMLVFVLVVVGLLLRGMSSEERGRFGKTILANLLRIKDVIARPSTGGEAFHAALRARTRWPLVTPAIVAAYVVVFFLLAPGSGDLDDPKTLIELGGSIGPRTTNGEWWRLGAAMFVHVSVLHLITEIAGLVQIGLLVERLVGRMAFAVLFVAAGVLAGIWNLRFSSGCLYMPDAAGAIFGVYGLLMASLVLGMIQRSTLTVPVAVLKGFWPGVAVFVLYNTLTEGLVSEAMRVGLVVGFTGGILVAGRIIADKPPVRRVAAVLAATVAIVVVLAAPLRAWQTFPTKWLGSEKARNERRARMTRRWTGSRAAASRLMNWPRWPIES